MGSQARQCDGAPEFIRGLCEEYLEEASGLWDQRRMAARAPHYGLNDLLEVDNRLEAQIDALQVAGEEGWEVCKEHFQEDEGSCFAAALLAFEGADEERISVILEKSSDPELSCGIISALQWLSYEKAEPHIRSLLKSDDPAQQAIGISATALHGRDPGPVVYQSLTDTGPQLRSAALLAVGQLGRKPETLLTMRLQNNFTNDDAAVGFAAAWSSARMGDREALDILKIFVNRKSPYREQALGIAMRRMDPITAHAWQKELAKSPETLRLSVQGAGIIGDPALVSWIIEQMGIPAQARVAGEALTMITGVDIKKEKLEGKWPEGFEAGPNDDPGDPNVEPDPDENLPWPDITLVTEWWNKNKNKYPGGTRLLMGKPITKETIAAVLQTGTQNQRAAAAMEAALRDPFRPMQDIYAPAWRQLPPQAPAPKAAANPPNYGPKELVITAVNCITPVGLDGAMTAASIRAGIDRFVFHDEYNDASGNPITAALIRGIWDEEDDCVELMRRYAGLCLEDMLEEYFQGNTRRPTYGSILLGVASESRPGPDYGAECINTQRYILADFVAQPSVELIPAGNSSMYQAIKRASRIIEEKPDALCIVGGIDTLLDRFTLNWFEADNRLKSPSYGRHHGLIASEAVCFLVIEERERAKKAGRPILARISSLGLKEESRPRASSRCGTYTGLAGACQIAMKPVRDREFKAVFGDLNGEDGRAEEWAVAALRCFKKGETKPPTFRLHDWYGDIGAASGAVMAAIASQGFTRNWLQSPIMIFCSDDHGSCGAIVLEKEIE
jgi:3-oxoacyl-[acyl-carrier-protein] synthase-1